MKKGDGVDCKCAASSCHDCGCGADWTPSEVYELREKLRIAREALRYTLSLGDLCPNDFRSKMCESVASVYEKCREALAELGER